MKYVRLALRLLSYAGAFGISILLLSALVIADWLAARPIAGKPSHRLRWTVVAKTEILRGSRLAEEQLEWQLSRLPEGEDCVSSTNAIVNKYAVRNMSRGTRLSTEDYTAYAPAHSSQGSVVVPVEVKTDYVSSLKPGMRVAFVQEKEILPSIETLTKIDPSHGFPLLAISTSQRDPTVTTLTVEIDSSNLAAVPKLGSGQWHPVVVNATAF